jgi:hypothetical protein
MQAMSSKKLNVVILCSYVLPKGVSDATKRKILAHVALEWRRGNIIHGGSGVFYISFPPETKGLLPDDWMNHVSLAVSDNSIVLFRAGPIGTQSSSGSSNGCDDSGSGRLSELVGRFVGGFVQSSG